MSQSQKPAISLSHASTPSDFYQISTLENRTFYHDPFTIVAYGPQRDSPANIAKRAEGLAKKPKKDGDREMVVMAKDKGGRVVGAAAWSFVMNRGKNEGAKGTEGVENDGKEAKEEGDGDADRWGIGANVKMCEDVFIIADEHMLRSCEGRDYSKLSTLVVAPDCQRQGIGSKLLEEGLRDVDKLGLQCVLAASKEGLGLYKKNGFVEFNTMKLRLWEYVGGESFGEEDHVVMHRPARS